MKSVEDLTIEEITKILSAAPEGAHRVSLLSTPCGKFGDYFFYRHFFNYIQQWIPSHGWLPVDDWVVDGTLRMDEIREKAQMNVEANDTSLGDFEMEMIEKYKVGDRVTHPDYAEVCDVKYNYGNGTLRITNGMVGKTVGVCDVEFATQEERAVGHRIDNGNK